MVMGLIAGEWLRFRMTFQKRLALLIGAGLICLAAGYALDWLRICPNVKRIWTPAWTLFSGGWCFVILGALHALLDVANRQTWSFPLQVIGMNSIAAYCIAHLWGGFIIKSFGIHFGPDAFKRLGSPYEPLLQGIAVLLVYWLILFWMYRRKIFLRI
jgi:predicted acyltransferase